MLIFMRKIVCLALLLACGIVATTRAQSKLSGLFNKNTLSDVAGSLLSKSTLSAADLEGTWHYASAACVFESDDLLKKAGGAVAASQLADKLDGIYSKVGLKPGSFSFTFGPDSTFTSTLGSRTLRGTYSLGEGTVTLHYKAVGIKTGSVTAHTQKAGDKLSMLFDADKLLKLLSTLCSITQNATLAAVAKIADGYDGMLIGYELAR